MADVERIYRMLQPMRVCLITSRHKGKDNVIAASWVFPLSMDPPLFGVSISPKRFSHGIIEKGKAFGINLPGPELTAAVLVCGRKTGKDADKFAEAGLTKEEGEKVPLIRECSASIECEVVDSFETGDHIVFVGKAINVVKRFESKGLYHKDESMVPI